MNWLIISILSYFFFGIASLGDKLFLQGPPKPSNYIFYVGFFSGLVVLLIPFIGGLHITSGYQLMWAFLEGVVYIFALYSLYHALEIYDVSRVIPFIGGLQPVLIFLFTILFFGYHSLEGRDIIAFVILILGSVLISIEKGKKVNKDALILAGISALLFAFDFVLTKEVFLVQSFWQGFVLMRFFSFLTVLCFLFDKKFRKEVLRANFRKTKNYVFLVAQGSGGLAVVLQNWAISLAPITYLAMINALKGTQYIFLLIFTLFMSVFFPKIFKEKITKKILTRKFLAILVIIIGLVLLVS